MLKLSLWNMGFIVANLLIFYFIVRRFLLKPVKEIMDRREQMVSEQLTAGEKAEKAAAEAQRRYEAVMQKADEESHQMVEEARKKARREEERIQLEAKEKEAEILKRAQEEARKQQEFVMKEAEGQIAALAASVAAKILMENSEEASARLYSQFAREAGGRRGSENR